MQREKRLKLRYNPSIICDFGETESEEGCLNRHEITPTGKFCLKGQVWADKVGEWKKNHEMHFVGDKGKCVPPIYISPGNIKTGVIPTWSLPAYQTCPHKTKKCKEACYAHKSENPYRGGVLPRRRANYWATQQPEFIDWMSKTILDMKTDIEKMPFHDPYTGKNYKGVIRLHESGDFYNKEYRNKIWEITRLFPDYLFYTYTQMCDWDDWNKKPDNFRFRCSVWPDTCPKKVANWRKHRYDLAIVEEPTNPTGKIFKSLKGLKVHQCPSRTAAITGKPKKTCDECRFCLGSKGNVLFVKEPSPITKDLIPLYKQKFRRI